MEKYSTPRRKLVVLGSGFAAFRLLKEIDLGQYDVVGVSPRNHFLFTPLLPSTTVGTVEFRSIIEPIRTAYPKVRFYQALAESVDFERKTLACVGAIDRHPFELPFDLLVIAVGAINNTFGIPGVEENSFFLKELHDARALRQRIIENFERAAQPDLTIEERKRLLHFVVVGGGPTGVEFAAEVHDFLTGEVGKAYAELRPYMQVTLLEAMEHILTTFDRALSEYTIKHFKRQGISIKTGSMVTSMDSQKIALRDGVQIPYGLVMWAAGVAQTGFVKSLPFEKDKSGRLITDPFLHLKGREDVYALGDCAVVEGKNLPATAQAAEQAGKYLAGALNLRALGRPAQPFRYHGKGMLAYVGSGRALADLSPVKGKGYVAWLFWRSAYLTKLVSFRSKALVLFDWCKAAIFGRDISRF